MASVIGERDVNWDVFRSVYPNLTFKELEDICDDIDFMYPHQRQFNAIHFYRMLKLLRDDLSIIELGCHQGHLADRILSQCSKVKSWVGYDFKSPLERTVCNDHRYKTVSLDNWFHETELPKCDVFIASHVLEHLSEDQVEKTMLHVNAKHFLIEVPLNEDGRDWNGWNCTHILKWGFKHLKEWLSENNFKIFYEMPKLGVFGMTKEPSNGRFNKNQMDLPPEL